MPIHMKFIGKTVIVTADTVVEAVEFWDSISPKPRRFEGDSSAFKLSKDIETTLSDARERAHGKLDFIVDDNKPPQAQSEPAPPLAPKRATRQRIKTTLKERREQCREMNQRHTKGLPPAYLNAAREAAAKAVHREVDINELKKQPQSQQHKPSSAMVGAKPAPPVKHEPKPPTGGGTHLF